jgi:hypothetical protein
MKKYLVLFVMSISAIFAQSQQVPRNKVIVEIGTATW